MSLGGRTVVVEEPLVGNPAEPGIGWVYKRPGSANSCGIQYWKSDEIRTFWLVEAIILMRDCIGLPWQTADCEPKETQKIERLSLFNPPQYFSQP